MPIVYVLKELGRWDDSDAVIGVYSTLEHAQRAVANRDADIYALPLDAAPAYYPPVPMVTTKGT